MKNYSVERILEENPPIKLPECTFCKSRCWQCIYFETDAPDSKGQCRCDFRGRWYYPTEGCGDGIPRPGPDPDPKPVQVHVPDHLPRHKSTSTRIFKGGSGSQSDTGGGGLLGLLFIWLAGSTILFSMGLLKPTYTFELNGGTLSAEQYAAYSINSVRMDDGVPRYPKNFKGYKSAREEFGENGRCEINLAKGKYDIWLSHDSISTYACGVNVGSFWDQDVPLELPDLERDDVSVALLRLQGKLGRKIAADDVYVTDREGNPVPCTPYGKDGQYLLLISDDQLDQKVASVMVCVEGYQDEEVVLDFSKGRIAELKVKLDAQ